MKTTWFEFKADGPHDFSAHVVRNRNNIKQIDLKSFKKWLRSLAFSPERGIYIFATGSKKPKPWYVGRTNSQSFCAECGAKEARINQMLQADRGAPQLFALRAPKGSSAQLEKAIDALETEMIRWCYSLNPNSLNDKKKEPRWDTFIPGVLRSGQGKPTKQAMNLRRLLRLA